MRKIILLLTILFFPLSGSADSTKGHEVNRIYRNGKITVVDVTYWEWESKTDTLSYSVMASKAIIKEALAKEPDLKLSEEATILVADDKVPDKEEIKLEGIHLYTYNVKKEIIAKEKITYSKDVNEKEIHLELNKRLTDILPALEIIPEQKVAK